MHARRSRRRSSFCPPEWLGGPLHRDGGRHCERAPAGGVDLFDEPWNALVHGGCFEYVRVFEFGATPLLRFLSKRTDRLNQLNQPSIKLDGAESRCLAGVMLRHSFWKTEDRVYGILAGLMMPELLLATEVGMWATSQPSLRGNRTRPRSPSCAQLSKLQTYRQVRVVLSMLSHVSPYLMDWIDSF
jgi:hypothetical protein